MADLENGNVAPDEIAKFDKLAAHWWDANGDMKPLHDINPLRLRYLERHAGIAGKRVLDVGCGGGLLSEAMAAHGARVTGIDMSTEALQVARLHLLESGQAVEYRHMSAEALADENPGGFDVVTCMELLEHVPDPSSLVHACAALTKTGGTVVFSTINRNPKSYLLAIVGAERLLRLLPTGTHEYSRFIRPSELDRFARSSGLALRDLTGLIYNPLLRRYSLSKDVDVNYLACYERLE